MHTKKTTQIPIPSILAENKQFKPLVHRYGIPEWEKRRGVFQSLVRSIIYQQVSGKAAASIFKKFTTLFGGRFPTPAQVLAKPLQELRGAGLSGQKASYIIDLATKIDNKTIKPRVFTSMTNDQIIEHLVQVKGIGVWTAQMFLMFTLKRPDVLPTLDLGIKKGFQVVFRLTALPSHDDMERLSRPWRQYATLASWYLWRAADDQKEKNPLKK